MLEKTFRPDEVEKKQYARWERSGAFSHDPRSDAVPYTVMMPPANVTGSLHIGHALTFTIQDVLTRYYRMSGRDALWQPGTDHAGIATQMVVERQLGEQGLHRRDLGRDKFLERVWDWKGRSGGTILRQLRRLGASADWPRERFTMDDGLSHAVRKVFVDLYKQGLIYRDKRLVNWDPKLRTAISDLEVRQIEIQGHLWHIRYPIEGEAGRYLVVATTRPETMLGDSGVAVHPDDERYRDIVGKHAILPLVGRRLPIVADEHADPETGSGAVKMTPAHDFNDFEVGKRRNLERISVLDADARINENAPEAYRGLDRFEARKRVVADLEAQGLLERIEDHTHTVPHGDRGGVPIEPRLTDQWYVDAATLAKPAIAAVETGRTRFVPKLYETVYFEWMRNIQPWCVSRQIWWGHRIPAWYGPDGAIFVEMTEAEARAAAAAHYGEAVALTRDDDVLDTWFSSALWPFSTLGWPEETAELGRYYPGAVLVTGYDIIFFWVARMMMMGIHFMGEVPFRHVHIHGLLRDERGQKMSKSKGNVMDPLDVIGKYGCDALRFTLASLSVPAGRDIKLAESRIEGNRNFTTKLWNAARYCLMNGATLAPDFDPANCRRPVNRWIVGKVSRAAGKLRASIEDYRLNEAAADLHAFIWREFCDWYIEFSKPLLNGGDAAAAAEVRATMGWAMGRILHLLHPLMPFITEEIWERFGGPDAGLLIAATLPDADPGLVDPVADAEIDWIVRLISEIRALRGEINVPPKAAVPLLVKSSDPATMERLGRHGDLVRQLARVESIAALDGGIPQGAVQLVVEEATAVLPLAEVIDLGAETARLKREIGKVQADIDRADKKLGNETFLAKAPADVVDEQRQRRAEAVAARDKLNAALRRLAGPVPTKRPIPWRIPKTP